MKSNEYEKCSCYYALTMRKQSVIVLKVISISSYPDIYMACYSQRHSDVEMHQWWGWMIFSTPVAQTKKVGCYT